MPDEPRSERPGEDGEAEASEQRPDEAAKEAAREREEEPAEDGPREAGEGDGDGDDDGDEEPEPPRPKKKKTKRKKVRARPRRRRKKKRKPLPKTERELNEPPPQTIFLLGVLAAVTLILWGAAKFACNAHPPQSRPHKAAKLEKLVKTPKDAAIEVQQRIATFRFDEASKIAGGELAAEVKHLADECAAHQAACDADRNSYPDTKLITTGELLEVSTQGKARVRVRTLGGKETDARYLIDLEYDSSEWKAIRRTKDDGSYRPKPFAHGAPLPGSSASAAPSASAAAAP